MSRAVSPWPHCAGVDCLRGSTIEVSSIGSFGAAAGRWQNSSPVRADEEPCRSFWSVEDVAGPAVDLAPVATETMPVTTRPTSDFIDDGVAPPH